MSLIVLVFHGMLARILRYTRLSDFLYSGTMENYLHKAGLGRLMESEDFLSGVVSQGYGFFDTVSSYHLFMWLRPSLFVTSIIYVLLNRGVGMVRGGYGTFFRSMYNTLGNTTKYMNTVYKDTRLVRRVDTDGNLLLDDDQIIHFDHIIVCCPLDEIETPVYISDDMTEHTIAHSFLWTSDYDSPTLLSHTIYLLDNIREKRTDRMFTIRRHGQTPTGEYIYWGFGTGHKDDDTLESYKKHAKAMGIPCKKVEYFHSFRYNPRFTRDVIATGIHRVVNDAQGEHNIWYLGGMLSHWDVDSIYEDCVDKITKMLLSTNGMSSNKGRLQRWYNYVQSFF